MQKRIPMSGRSLKSPCSFGCVTIEDAERLQLSEVVVSNRDSELVLVLSGDQPAPWDKPHSVVIHMFQLPDGAEELDRLIEWYGRDRNPRARLPEGRGVNQDDLAPAKILGSWLHDHFAVSGRNLFHIYRTNELAVFIRLFGLSGSMLTHPLLSAVASKLTIDPDQWVTDVPGTKQGTATAFEAVEVPMTKQEFTFLAKSRAEYQAALGVRPDMSGEVIATIVHEQMRNVEVLPLAIAWADALCKSAGWEWAFVDEELVVVSKDRAYLIDQFALIEANKARDDDGNSLLLFNMIRAGHFPPSSPKAYLPLG